MRTAAYQGVRSLNPLVVRNVALLLILALPRQTAGRMVGKPQQIEDLEATWISSCDDLVAERTAVAGILGMNGDIFCEDKGIKVSLVVCVYHIFAFSSNGGGGAARSRRQESLAPHAFRNDIAP